MTDEELAAELEYRKEERLGILTDGRAEPGPEFRELAQQEAEDWLEAWFGQSWSGQEPVV